MTEPAAFTAQPQPAQSFMSVNTAVVNELKQEISPSKQFAYLQMSEEEHVAVLAKLSAVAILPAGHLPLQEELYLEQQLTDILGFEVNAELDNQRLNHTIGTMVALPHLRRSPTDTLVQHQVYQEAGLGPYRSVFGWFTEMGQVTATMNAREQYYIAVQADFVPTWHQEYQQLKNWYKFRKMMVINPTEAKAVVVSVGNIGPADWMQYQFGGSPEVIREAGIWSPTTRGKVLVFFINDPQNTVPLGVISLQYQDLLRRSS